MNEKIIIEEKHTQMGKKRAAKKKKAVEEQNYKIKNTFSTIFYFRIIPFFSYFIFDFNAFPERFFFAQTNKRYEKLLKRKKMVRRWKICKQINKCMRKMHFVCQRFLSICELSLALSYATPFGYVIYEKDCIACVINTTDKKQANEIWYEDEMN